MPSIPSLRTVALLPIAFLAALLLPLVASCRSGGEGKPTEAATVIVSLSAAGVQSASNCDLPALSFDGKIVAFQSVAADLSPIDNSGTYVKVFVKNRVTGKLALASVGLDNAAADGSSMNAALDASGNRVFFQSTATNLIDTDGNAAEDIFLRDLAADNTWRVSVADDGSEANGASANPRTDNTGTKVVFQSVATNLVATAPTASTDVYLRALALGTTIRVSAAPDGTPGDGNSSYPILTADGRFVLFASNASNLVADDTNGATDLFLKNLGDNTVERVSLAWDNGQIATGSSDDGASVSGDGRFVSFYSGADNIVGTDNNGVSDVFVRDRLLGTTEIVSVSTGGAPGDRQSRYSSISQDGRFVAFQSFATNWGLGENPNGDIFVRDRLTNTTSRSGLAPGGTPANNCPGAPVITGDGTTVSFASRTTNLVPGDANGTTKDVFLHRIP